MWCTCLSAASLLLLAAVGRGPEGTDASDEFRGGDWGAVAHDTYEGFTLHAALSNRINYRVDGLHPLALIGFACW